MKSVTRPTLLTNIYNEAMQLMSQARAYAQENGPMDFMGVNVELGLVLAMETTRISSRLTQAIAWYLTQNAYLEEHVTLAEARDEANRIQYTGELANRETEADLTLPHELLRLLKASHDLYERVCRLDDVFRRNTAA
jgi:regulator of CtrA degradation